MCCDDERTVYRKPYEQGATGHDSCGLSGIGCNISPYNAAVPIYADRNSDRDPLKPVTQTPKKAFSGERKQKGLLSCLPYAAVKTLTVNSHLGCHSSRNILRKPGLLSTHRTVLQYITCECDSASCMHAFMLHICFRSGYAIQTTSYNKIFQIGFNADLAVSKVMSTGHHLCYSKSQPQDIEVNMTSFALNISNRRHARTSNGVQS